MQILLELQKALLQGVAHEQPTLYWMHKASDQLLHLAVAPFSGVHGHVQEHLLLAAAAAVATVDVFMQNHRKTSTAATAAAVHDRVRRRRVKLQDGKHMRSKVRAHPIYTSAQPVAAIQCWPHPPTCAAKSDRIPLPAPTSMTVLPSKSALFSVMAAW